MIKWGILLLMYMSVGIRESSPSTQVLLSTHCFKIHWHGGNTILENWIVFLLFVDNADCTVIKLR